MKKDTLTHKEEKKISKKNMVLICILILLVLCFLSGISYYFLIYNKESNVLKRYLLTNDYTCNEKSCTKNISNNLYSINYYTGKLTVSNQDFIFKLSPNNLPTLEVKENDYICLFEKENYKPTDFIDENFVYNNYCKKYIDDINEIISFNILIYEEAGVNYYS